MKRTTHVRIHPANARAVRRVARTNRWSFNVAANELVRLGAQKAGKAVKP